MLRWKQSSRSEGYAMPDDLQRRANKSMSLPDVACEATIRRGGSL